MTSTYFIGDKTTNRLLFEGTLREIESTIIDIDGIDMQEEAEAIINPEEVVEQEEE